jgi:hypothetical protein
MVGTRVPNVQNHPCGQLASAIKIYCIYIASRHAAKYLSVTRAWELFPFYELLKKMGLNYEKVSYSQ